MDVRVKYIEVNIDLKPVRKVKHMTFENKNHLNKPITDIRPSLKEEREQEKKELQSLYDQLSAALAASGETV